MEYLVSLGHRRIAHISGGMNTFPGRSRQLGYEKALEQWDLERKESYIVTGEFYTLESGYEAMKQLLQLPEVPTAVFASGDLLALGAMMAVKDSGLNVPGDISIMGYDDVDLAKYVTPALTTIRQDTAKLGSEAAEILFASIKEPQKGHTALVLPTTIMLRDSCAPPASIER